MRKKQSVFLSAQDDVKAERIERSTIMLETGITMFMKDGFINLKPSRCEFYKQRLKVFSAWASANGIDNVVDISPTNLREYRFW